MFPACILSKQLEEARGVARGRNAALTSTCPVPGTNRSLRYWRAGMQQHREGVAGLQICKSVSGSKFGFISVLYFRILRGEVRM